ncbi:tetratricopeptide repeat domain protein [Fulvivirga imtechensis AK7]|uniref:Tetratricopeptide repeat domain protein n=1 Tax=Fulvivirga imtechensis AK7 TaxID=1237149 RepID=L8JUG2_9BACT|nr:CHAT domain-containing protein [Fulvivirga imtechensis]ELR70927.1 tetratricopeptide repeat domain protein [Fulvivirga imtechensis AK7]
MIFNVKSVKCGYDIYKKSVQYGLFVFLIFISSLGVNAQDYSDENTFIDDVNAMMDRHYFENPDSALYYLNFFLKEAYENDWERGYLFALINKAYVAEHHFMIDSLNSYLDEADSIVYHYQNAGDSTILGNELVREVSYMRGMYYYYQGDFSNALGNFKQTVFDNGVLVISDSLQTFNSLVNICQLSIMDGDYQNALQYVVMARHVLPGFNPSYNSVRDHSYQLAFIESVQAKILYHQNTILQEAEVYHDVITILKNSLTKLNGKENTPGAHNLYLKIYTQLADAYMGLGSYERALSALEKGLKLSKQADPEQQMKLLFETASIYLKMNNTDAALKYIEKGQLLAGKGVDGGNRFKARASYEKGNVFMLQKKWEKALTAYQDALQYLAGSTESVGIYETPQIGTETLESEFLKVILLKADSFYDWYVNEGEPKYLLASIESYEQAVRLIDHIRMGFQSAESKQFLASVTLSTFERGLQATFEAYEITSDPLYLEKAFYFSEKSRASQLIEAVRDMSSKLFAGVPDALIHEENQLKGRIYYWQQSLLELSNESAVRKERQHQLLQARERYHALIETLEAMYPEYHRLKYKSSTLSTDQLQNGLEPDETVIEYFYGDNDLYVFGISRDKSILRKMSNKTLDQQLLVALNELKNPPTADSAYQHYLKVSHGLYQTLIEPLKEVLPALGGRLLLISDGLLGYFPFETLVESENVDKEGTQPVMLLNKYSVGYDYSVSLMKEKENMTRSKGSNDYMGFAPEYSEGLLAMNDRSFLSKLKFNDQEVKQAYAYFGGKIFFKSVSH